MASWLLPAHLRPHVAAFYRYARAIDDIADNPALTADDKIARLDRFAAAITGAAALDPALDTAHRMRDSLTETGVTPRHCLDLIAAFKQDAVKLRYDDWDDLMGYCALSANPVGRYLLDLHGEDAVGYPLSDALCSALQILNHLQDCQEDCRRLDRIYLPQSLMHAYRLTERSLEAPRCAPGLRRVLDDCLEGVEDLLLAARLLPPRLRNRGLAMEASVILHLAKRLMTRLRTNDPLARRVALTRTDFIAAGLRGALREGVRRRTRDPRSAAQPASSDAA